MLKSDGLMGKAKLVALALVVLVFGFLPVYTAWQARGARSDLQKLVGGQHQQSLWEAPTMEFASMTVTYWGSDDTETFTDVTEFEINGETITFKVPNGSGGTVTKIRTRVRSVDEA